MTREIGKVKYYNADKGFGFIARNEGEDAFFHISKFIGKEAVTVEQGTEVEYDLDRNDRGFVASNIAIRAR